MSARVAWAWRKYYAKQLFYSTVAGVLVAVEIRDQHNRRSWAPEYLPPDDLHTGDIVMVCNRWFNLGNPVVCMHSFFSKLVQKSSFDCCGVIIRNKHDNDTPYVLIQDYKTIKFMPLGEYISERVPRGVAVRRLDRTFSKPIDEHKLNSFLSTKGIDMVKYSPSARLESQRESAAGEGSASSSSGAAGSNSSTLGKFQPRNVLTMNPWYVVRAAYRENFTTRHYLMCCKRSEAELIYLKKKHGRFSKGAVRDALEGFEAIDSVCQRLAEDGIPPPIQPMKNTCASLVAGALGACGYLPNDLPDHSNYVPIDFMANMPFLSTSVAQSQVIFVD